MRICRLCMLEACSCPKDKEPTITTYHNAIEIMGSQKQGAVVFFDDGRLTFGDIEEGVFCCKLNDVQMLALGASLQAMALGEWNK